MNHKLVGYLFVCIAFLVAGPGNAQAEGPFPITAEFLESQKGPEGVWPDDPSVPDMPPLPDTADPGLDPNSFLTTHYTNTVYPAKIPNPPAPLNENVHGENPLEVVIYWSMRSPYSYLSMDRLLYLHSNYNVDVSVRVIFPVAVRTRHKGGKAGSGRWYFFGYSTIDMERTGLYEGIPFRFANPDPILQDHNPQGECTGLVAPMELQPYIAWLVRLASAAQLAGKTLEYCLAVSPLIWGARTKVGEWPLHVEAAVNSIGMDYDATIKDIQANPDKYDAVWQQNQIDFQATGQGGVPTMSWNGEPFFGQDRFNQFFWRLRENGLAKRQVPREPMVAQLLRWPSSPGGE